MAGRNPPWSEAEVRNLGLHMPLPIAASVLGIGRTKAYQLAKAGEFPVTVVKIGQRYRVPTASVLGLLGILNLGKSKQQRKRVPPGINDYSSKEVHCA